VVKRCRVPGLAPEPLDELRILRVGWAEKLDRDIAIKALIMSTVHDRHPALPDHLEEPVALGKHTRRGYHRVIGL
jgi:hypothetical protein